MLCPRNYFRVFQNLKTIQSSVNKCFLKQSQPKISMIFVPVRRLSRVKEKIPVQNIPSMELMKRIPKRKRIEEDGKSGLYSVHAYSTCDRFNLMKLESALKEQGLYHVNLADGFDPDNKTTKPSVEPHVIHARAIFPAGETLSREIYIFREGTLVLWNVSDSERENILRFIRPYEINRYDKNLVEEESEVMDYGLATPGQKTGLYNGCIRLAISSNSSMSHDPILSLDTDSLSELSGNDLDKYTFSNALALSVKLAIWEAALERYIDSIAYITEDLKQGRHITITRQEVLRKTGELLALRHAMNLGSDLLDTPDFYWDREIHERLYDRLSEYLSISRRTRVMNDKLNHCLELAELLRNHLSDKHHVRLEWMIIILIMVEVAIECLHFIH